MELTARINRRCYYRLRVRRIGFVEMKNDTNYLTTRAIHSVVNFFLIIKRMIYSRNNDHSKVHFVFNILNERLYYIIFMSCVWIV